MTDDELRELSRQLVQAVANRTQHIIHADDPIMALAVMLQVIASNARIEQQRLLDDYSKEIMTQTLRIQANTESTAQNMLERVRADVQTQVEGVIQQTMQAGANELKEMIRTKSGKALAAQRVENTAVRESPESRTTCAGSSSIVIHGRNCGNSGGYSLMRPNSTSISISSNQP